MKRSQTSSLALVPMQLASESMKCGKTTFRRVVTAALILEILMINPIFQRCARNYAHRKIAFIREKLEGDSSNPPCNFRDKLPLIPSVKSEKDEDFTPRMLAQPKKQRGHASSVLF